MSDLTPELKAKINAMSYEDLLRRWRFSPAGEDEIFQGPSGEYYSKVMAEKKHMVGPAEAVAISKKIGW